MTRYPDEKPVDHAPITTEAGGAMRSQAGTGGDLVIVLKRGTEVEKLAEHDVYYLVLADDPKDPTRKLMGWIAESAFSGGAPHQNEPERRADGGAAPSGADGASARRGGRRGHEAGPDAHAHHAGRSLEAPRREEQQHVSAGLRLVRGDVPARMQDRRGVRPGDGPLLRRLLPRPGRRPMQMSWNAD